MRDRQPFEISRFGVDDGLEQIRQVAQVGGWFTQALLQALDRQLHALGRDRLQDRS